MAQGGTDPAPPLLRLRLLHWIPGSWAAKTTLTSRAIQDGGTEKGVSEHRREEAGEQPGRNLGESFPAAGAGSADSRAGGAWRGRDDGGVGSSGEGRLGPPGDSFTTLPFTLQRLGRWLLRAAGTRGEAGPWLRAEAERVTAAVMIQNGAVVVWTRLVTGEG